MGKKKHAEHVNHERWLVSYADLLTLLFAFFVVLFASSVSDKKKTAQMAAAMQTAFTEHGVFEAHAATPPLEQGGASSQGKPAPLMEPVQMVPSAGDIGPGSAAAKAVQQQVQKVLGAALANGSATLRQTSEGLTISLHEAGFFESGTAEINPGMAAVLAQIATSLPDRDLRIEGHTDNLPIHSGRFRSNWELSTARAEAIAEMLMAHSHISPARFSLAGYGPFRPMTGNDTAVGRARNRRVDIVLLGTGSPPAKLTLAADAIASRANQAAETAKDRASNVESGASRSAKSAISNPQQLPDVPFAAQSTQPQRQSMQPQKPVATGGPRILQLATEADRAAAH